MYHNNGLKNTHNNTVVHQKVSMTSQIMVRNDHMHIIIPTYYIKHNLEHDHYKSNSIKTLVKISPQTHPISCDCIWKNCLGVYHKNMEITSLRSGLTMGIYLAGVTISPIMLLGR